jgi:hypothetical protein
MVATPHMLVGAAGALKARSAMGGLAIGVLTHLAVALGGDSGPYGGGGCPESRRR